ncbi:MAG: hypothetical protein VX835_01885 [Pseudomonadota bacterium]|nr:hypothetical protein [Pseudomonadota bacterium]
MADNDTYQYQEDDAVKSSRSYEDYVEDTPNSGAQTLLNNPKFIGLASLVIGVYLVGYIVSMFYETTSTQQKPVVTQTMPEPKNDQMDQLSETVLKQQKLIQQLSTSNQQLNIAVSDLKKDISALKNSQGSQSYVKAEVEKSDLNKLSNQLADLRDRVISTEKALKAMEPKPAKKPLAQYYLRGIIDGRAWVTGPKGNNQTVRIGDSLPDYGKITGVFPDAGFIMTESKRKITFSKGDS